MTDHGQRRSVREKWVSETRAHLPVHSPSPPTGRHHGRDHTPMKFYQAWAREMQGGRDRRSSSRSFARSNGGRQGHHPGDIQHHQQQGHLRLRPANRSRQPRHHPDRGNGGHGAGARDRKDSRERSEHGRGDRGRGQQNSRERRQQADKYRKPPGSPRGNKRTAPGPDKSTDKRRKNAQSRSRSRSFSIASFREDDEEGHDIKALDAPFQPDDRHYDARVLYGMRVPKKIPATAFTTSNNVAGRDPMSLPVRKMLYKEDHSYAFRMLSNGRFCALLGARSTNELYLCNALLGFFRKRDGDALNIKSLATQIADNAGLPKPIDSATRKKVWEYTVNELLVPKLREETTKAGQSNKEIDRLRMDLADARKKLLDKLPTPNRNENISRMTFDHLDKFRRSPEGEKLLEKKVSDLSNKATKDYLLTIGLSLPEKKEMASLFAELQHTVTPTKGTGGEIIVSRAESLAAPMELARIAEDWGIRKALLAGRTAGTTNSMLELICLANVLAPSNR